MTQPHGNKNPEAEFKTLVKITRKFRFLDQGKFQNWILFSGLFWGEQWDPERRSGHADF